MMHHEISLVTVLGVRDSGTNAAFTPESVSVPGNYERPRKVHSLKPSRSAKLYAADGVKECGTRLSDCKVYEVNKY